jgi:hypothetical protein
MPDQTPSLNIKANDMGWQGTQIQLYTCAECGTQSSGAGQHSAWHDNINNAIQQAYNLAQQALTAAQQEAGRAQGVEANLQAQINTKT